MSLLCDICSKPVEPGEPRMGMKGTGGKDGSPLGKDRHYTCHADKYGRQSWGSGPNIQNLPVRTEAGRQVREAFISQAKTVLKPRVKQGPYNRSANAQRQARNLGRVDAVGRSRVKLECPFCYERFWAFIWSLCGGGKKCPNCGAIHGGTLMASPIEGNEELGS